MGKPRWIETEQQKEKAEKVISMLGHKIKKGTATDEERERYRRGCEDLVIYDWGTPSYQDLIPNMIRERERKQKESRPKGLIARRSLPDTEKKPAAIRPPLTRREGRFAV